MTLLFSGQNYILYTFFGYSARVIYFWGKGIYKQHTRERSGIISRLECRCSHRKIMRRFAVAPSPQCTHYVQPAPACVCVAPRARILYYIRLYTILLCSRSQRGVAARLGLIELSWVFAERRLAIELGLYIYTRRWSLSANARTEVSIYQCKTLILYIFSPPCVYSPCSPSDSNYI